VSAQNTATDTSLESCDLNGANKAMLADVDAEDFIWLSSGNLVYASESNLWETRVQSGSGIHRADPRQLTDWSGFLVRNLSTAADGKRMAHIRDITHDSVFVGELARNCCELGF